MAEEAENLTIRPLQEMRADMAGIRAEMASMRTDLTHRIDRISEQLRDVKRNGDGNSLLLAGLAGYIRDHEDRIESPESSKSAS